VPLAGGGRIEDWFLGGFMAWSPVASKEARIVATSNGSWLLAALLVFWGHRPIYVGWDGLGPNITAAYIQFAGTELLPFGILLLSYLLIVGEGTSGSVRFVLGHPLRGPMCSSKRSPDVRLVSQGPSQSPFSS